MPYSVPSPNEGVYNGQIKTLLLLSSVNQSPQSFVQQVDAALTALCLTGCVSMIDAQLSRVVGERDKPERYQFLLTYRQLPALMALHTPLRAAYITATSNFALEVAVQLYFAAQHPWPTPAVPIRCFDISPNRNTQVPAASVMVLYYAPSEGQAVLPGIERLNQRVYIFEATTLIPAWSQGTVYIINATKSRVTLLQGVNRRNFSILQGEKGYALFDVYTGRLNLYVFTHVDLPATVITTEDGYPIETEDGLPLLTEGI